MMQPTGSIKRSSKRKVINPNGRMIDYDINKKLKGNEFSYIMMQPTGSIKRSSKRKVINPNGRMIYYDGPQYNRLIKSGYKLNDDGTQLIIDRNFTGVIVKSPVGRPKGK